MKNTCFSNRAVYVRFAEKTKQQQALYNALSALKKDNFEAPEKTVKRSMLVPENGITNTKPKASAWIAKAEKLNPER